MAPHYDYECRRCGVVEVWQRMTEAPHRRCPRCGARARRLIGAGSALMFLGPGWQTNSRLDREKKFVVSPKQGKREED